MTKKPSKTRRRPPASKKPRRGDGPAEDPVDLLAKLARVVARAKIERILKSARRPPKPLAIFLL
ncbi:MAG: hypothetical protein HY292_26545 [Planctomycetes bacterium]|nr:hypothetical protein [Planctomycetota bacterium]